MTGGKTTKGTSEGVIWWCSRARALRIRRDAPEVTCPTYHIVGGDRMLRWSLIEMRRQTLSEELREMRETCK